VTGARYGVRIAHSSRGLTEEEAAAMIVNGFIEPVTKELPMEYAVELNRLIQLEMVDSIG
jgi:Fe-S cluster assembly protein SufB